MPDKYTGIEYYPYLRSRQSLLREITHSAPSGALQTECVKFKEERAWKRLYGEGGNV